MRVTALLDPQIFDVDLLTVTIGPEKIGVTLASRDDVFVGDKWNDPFFLRPNSRPVRINVLTDTAIEKFNPTRRGSRAQSFHIMSHFE
jgi:hypothetical protein